MLQQQQELQQRQELQEYRQDTEESTTNEPLGGQKRSRLDSSTSSTSSVSPMKPPTKRPVIQHDSSSSSNEVSIMFIYIHNHQCTLVPLN